MNWSAHKPFIIILILVLLTSIYLLIQKAGVSDLILDMEVLILRVRALGAVGPSMVIGLMILAIVFNPLPSAPVAFAAGAVYGHSWGTLYIIIGAGIGAITAFLIARFIAFDFVTKHLGNRFSLGQWGSQNSLMAIIFVSRLIPVMSFDLVSYGAGLTTITLWRFAIATLFGLIPASLLLAHFGGEMAQGDIKTMTFFILAAGLITLIPVCLKILMHYKHSSSPELNADQKSK